MLVVLDGCATSRPANDVSDEKLCLYVRDIRNYQPFDDKHVLIEARSKKYYLVTMVIRCDGLAFAQGIGIEGSMSRVCNDGLGTISFRDPHQGVRRCRIAKIEPVADADAARAPIAERESSD